MEHFLDCNNIPYTVVTCGAKCAALPQGQGVEPDAGPSCQWQFDFAIKVCYQRGVGQIVCAKYIAGYDHDCAPPSVYDKAAAKAMHTWAKSDPNVSVSGLGTACGQGYAVAGAVGIVIAAAGGPVGILSEAAAGCVGGVISYILFGH
jgi:hypothetical protein